MASRDASAAEHRAAGLEGRLQAAAVDANAARDAAEKAEGSLAALEQEHAALKEEYAAVAEDLTVMARENQVCLLRNPPPPPGGPRRSHTFLAVILTGYRGVRSCAKSESSR